MKRSLFFYYLSLTISVILAIFGIINVDSHTSVYDATPAIAPITSIPVIQSSAFSTANVVKIPIDLFSPIVDTDNMKYQANGYDYSYDSNVIMHYTRNGGKFYYAHNSGAFAALAKYAIGTKFYMGNTQYIVKKINTITFEQTKQNMNSIIKADHIHDVSLMTCAGSMGYFTNNSGDIEYTASHRLIIYADKV